MNKKTQLAIGMGLLFGSGTVLAQPTDPVLIDFDGTEVDNGAVSVGSLDWFVGSSLSDQTLTSPDNFTIYTHAALSGASDTGGNPIGISGLNTDFEWTFIAGLNETVTGESFTFDKIEDNGGVGDVYNLSGSITLEDSADQSGFFFNIYYDDNNATFGDALSGEGYDDGTLILSGAAPISASGNFTSDLGSFVDVDGSGGLSAGDTWITDPADPNWAYALLDSFGSDDWSDVDVTYYSVEGEGATTLEAEVGSQDTDYFKTLISSIFSDTVFSTENVDPFLETNPSKCFDTDGSTMADNDGSTACLDDGDIVLGDVTGSDDVINGVIGLDGTTGVALGNGQDVLFQTDANQAFRVTQVPEPSIIALLGLGLGLLGITRRRRA